jgi:hypothetical protein
MSNKISQELLKKLRKKYRKQPGTPGIDSRKISKMLAKGAIIPAYTASKGGYIAKKRKKKK